MKTFLLSILIALQSFLGIYSVQNENLGTAVPTTVAFFQTSLQASIGTTDSTMTLVSGTTSDGTTLSGFYGFVIDEGTSSAEIVTCTAASTALTGCSRGI